MYLDLLSNLPLPLLSSLQSASIASPTPAKPSDWKPSSFRPWAPRPFRDPACTPSCNAAGRRPAPGPTSRKQGEGKGEGKAGLRRGGREGRTLEERRGQGGPEVGRSKRRERGSRVPGRAPPQPPPTRSLCPLLLPDLLLGAKFPKLARSNCCFLWPLFSLSGWKMNFEPRCRT